KLRIVTLVLFILLSHPGFARQEVPVSDSHFYNSVSRWFDAWELISKDVYHLDRFTPTEFVFFDEQYVYSTSPVSVPEGEVVKGPELLHRRFVWRKALHKDSITLPDKSRLPVGLMSFASGLPGAEGKAFFVMPLPRFWHTAGVTSRELGTENLITGVFLHEFSHSQQVQNFGKRITELERKDTFGKEFSDDIVQDLFKNDSAYTSLYNREVTAFYVAVPERDKAAKRSGIKTGLDLLQTRHHRFFTNRYEALKDIDALFLTMEGLGQYTMYRWLIHKKGAALPAPVAIQGVRRGKNNWSQDEGFALFLLLEQFSDADRWAGPLFGDKTESVLAILEQQLGR
ncbi:MAG TPA: hypothetical protein VHK69_10505, partial [Chitinophagaceae bacterium]|nr:hypothetical protein [Chitinophagaceae bacterium]